MKPWVTDCLIIITELHEILWLLSASGRLLVKEEPASGFSWKSFPFFLSLSPSKSPFSIYPFYFQIYFKFNLVFNTFCPLLLLKGLSRISVTEFSLRLQFTRFIEYKTKLFIWIFLDIQIFIRPYFFHSLTSLGKYYDNSNFRTPNFVQK